MTHGTIAAIMFRDMISGKPNKWEKLFDPSRQMSSEITEFIKHNVSSNAMYKDWFLKKSEVKDIEDIKLGCGAVMRYAASNQSI